jgi:hypothetical protein
MKKQVDAVVIAGWLIRFAAGLLPLTLLWILNL